MNNEQSKRHEHDRLEALHSMHVLDTPIEERFDRITRLAKQAFQVPISALSCVDDKRVWFKSVQGLSASEVERSVSFCQHTILQDKVAVVRDAREDPRFFASPQLLQDPPLVFYAGAPIFTSTGLPIATFCIMDTEPRDFSPEDQRMLEDFAKLAERELHAAPPNNVEHQLINQVGPSWRSELIDPLTRLWNAEGISIILGESLENAKTTGSGICAVLIDIAEFRLINEKIGKHDADKLLRAFASNLLRAVRKDDAVGRIHGDQFLIVMSSLYFRSHATAAIDRLKTVINTFRFDDIDNCPEIRTNASALYSPDDWLGTIESLTEQLTDALYIAKQSQDCAIQLTDIEPPPDSDHHAA